MKKIELLLVVLLLVPHATAEDRIDLSGKWQVRLDPDARYEPVGANATEEAEDAFQPVHLPGSLRDSGLGKPVGAETYWIGGIKEEVWNRPGYKQYQRPDQFKVPFWLQPERHYVGQAYYRRVVRIPELWRRKRVLLTLERPHWRTQVLVDGTRVGANDSLSTAHVYDLTKLLTPGRHMLAVGVDNSLEPLDVGLNSHSVSDHTQTAWHGIVGKIELRAEPNVAIGHVDVFPSEDARSARIKLQLSNMAGREEEVTVAMRVSQDGQTLGERTLKIMASKRSTTIDSVLPFDREAKRWDEFHPNLCRVEITLSSREVGVSTKQVSFGVRHIETGGTRFLLNGRPLFLRGTLECCIFPLTGYPPTDVESWERIIRICKSHGLNHIRFHSWCPPEAAFQAADQLGFYYQVECSSWPNGSTSLGNGLPIDEWLYREGDRVLEAYGNHPSFLLFAMGNEPGGPERGGKYLGPWVERFRTRTDRQLVTSGSGWPSIPENEYHVTPRPRIQQWGQGIRSRINAEPPETMTDYREFVGSYDVPVISHEIGQWCVYPNFAEMDKYTGALKPRNFEIFHALLANAQMLDQADDFLMASGKLQTLCYKEEIESALRTPGFGGFQLLDLHDFPGQGTALVGVLDPFWDSKPYVSADDFRRFCGPTVPLARLQKRIWTSQEAFAADIEVSHFGPQTMHGVTPHWSITRGDKVLASGDLAGTSIPTGELSKLGLVRFSLQRFEHPEKLTLTVSLRHDDHHFENDWQFWVYPHETGVRPNGDVLLVDEMTDAAATRLKAGGKVVLLANHNRVDTDVAIGFSSIFWNTAWTGGQAPQTLGIFCDPKHPALAAFPTDYHSDWQWWELISRSKPMVLDKLPAKLRPIVQVVPDWFRPQRLGLVFEAKVGAGKLLVCSMDLTSELERRPVARQMRHSLMQYAASDAFTPDFSISLNDVRALYREPSVLERIGASIRAGSAHKDHPAEYAIDGNSKTIWHSDWEPTPAPMPHSLILDLGKPRSVLGVRYLPRQDLTNGRIAEYAIHVSDDGQDWGEAIATGTFLLGAQPQIVTLARPHTTRLIKLVARREVSGKPYASVAEIDVLLADEAAR